LVQLRREKSIDRLTFNRTDTGGRKATLTCAS
jgi:hypothetical protein